MSRWDTVALADAPWILPSEESRRTEWFGRGDVPIVLLRDVAQVRHDYALLTDGMPLVRPRDVDESNGTVITIERANETRGFALDLNLQRGDVLVSRFGSSFPILVTEDLRGVGFSSAFLVLRPAGHGLALWAILASVTGRSALSSAGVARAGERWQALLDLALPVPIELFAEAASPFVPTLSPDAVEARSQDKWAVAWLTDEWRIRRPDTSVGAIRLGDVAAVSVGDVRPDNCFGAPDGNRLPVLDDRVLRGRTTDYSRFAAEGHYRETDDRTVVLSTFPPFAPQRPGRKKLVLSRLIRIQFRDGDPAVADAFCTWVRSTAGQAELRAATTGSVMSRITVRALRDVRFVPRDDPKASATVSERIEQAIRFSLAKGVL